MGEKAKADDCPRKMRITFKDTAEPGKVADGIRFLLVNYKINIDSFDLSTLGACAAFGGWGGDQNRTLVVTLAEDLDVRSFFQILTSPTIEKFEFVR